STAAAFLDRWWIAEALTVAIVAGIVAFALRRFVAGGAARRPPAAFVLLPMGLACAVAGAVLVGSTTVVDGPSTVLAGRLLLEQGVFLCLVMGAGSLVLPLMSGAAPPPDLGTTPAVTRRAVTYGAAGLIVVSTLLWGAARSSRLAPGVRGLVVAAPLVSRAGLLSPPQLPGRDQRLAPL